EPGRPSGMYEYSGGVGAGVDVLGDRFAVQQVRDGLAHGPGLVRVRVLGLLAVGVRVDVEHDVADLPAGTLVHGDGVVGLEVLDVGGGQRPPHAVDVALLDVQLHVV